MESWGRVDQLSQDWHLVLRCNLPELRSYYSLEWIHLDCVHIVTAGSAQILSLCAQEGRLPGRSGRKWMGKTNLCCRSASTLLFYVSPYLLILPPLPYLFSHFLNCKVFHPASDHSSLSDLYQVRLDCIRRRTVAAVSLFFFFRPSGGKVRRFPDTSTCAQRALVPRPGLLWSLRGDAVRAGQTGTQMWW